MGKNKNRQIKNDGQGGQPKSDGIGGPMRAKPIPIGTINDTFINYYKSNLIPNTLSEDDFSKMIDIYRTPLPTVFRISTNFPHYQDVENEMNGFFQTIKNEGVDIIEYTYFPKEKGRIYKTALDKALLRRDPRFRPFRDWLNLQTELGICHRQEFVSMVPPYFLNVQPTDSCLDMCAAPGSKTAQIVESLDKEQGMVFANDTDPRRCRTLVHNLQKVGTQNVLVTSQKAQTYNSNGVLFDKVLCDVPCTGDGTLRKNAVAGSKFSPKNAGSLHGTQRRILQRGLELTKVGGYCVYSTCSMNPIEDEAVVNSVLLETQGNVEIVDCSAMYPELTRHSGMTTWKVFDVGNEDLNTCYEKFDDVPTERRQLNNNTMFPQPQVPNLSCCMRFFPQDHDGGGFFVVVLHKIKDFDRLTNPPSTPQKPLKEAPYITMTQGNQEVLAAIKNTFAFDEHFPTEQLFVRNEKSVHNIAFIGKKLTDVIIEHGSPAFYTISCGSPIFTWRTFSKGNALPYPAMEGVPIILKYAHKRLFVVKPEEMKKLLAAGHEAVKYTELSEETYNQMKGVESTGALFYIPDTPFAYGGMTFTYSCSIYLRKDLLPVELKRLICTYPKLADSTTEKIVEEGEKIEEKDDDE